MPLAPRARPAMPNSTPPLPSALFNLLTGSPQPPVWKRFVASPIDLHEWVLAMIDAEVIRDAVSRGVLPALHPGLAPSRR